MTPEQLRALSDADLRALADAVAREQRLRRVLGAHVLHAPPDPDTPHLYRAADDSPAAGSISQAIGAWPCQRCGCAPSDVRHAVTPVTPG